MPAPLFLFGTDHRYQCGGRDCLPQEAQAFASELLNQCRVYGVRRIAEEMSDDGRRNYEVGETLSQRVARQLDIHHHDIDLTGCERSMLALHATSVLSLKSEILPRDGGARLLGGIDRLITETRERIWAARIASCNPWPALFVLGADHVESFQRVWRRLGARVALLHRDYAPFPPANPTTEGVL